MSRDISLLENYVYSNNGWQDFHENVTETNHWELDGKPLNFEDRTVYDRRNEWVIVEDEKPVILGFGRAVREVDSYGGEGQGDEYWSVIEFEDEEGTFLVELRGYYQSYDGGYYDSAKLVKPVQKTVTVYE